MDWSQGNGLIAVLCSPDRICSPPLDHGTGGAWERMKKLPCVAGIREHTLTTPLEYQSKDNLEPDKFETICDVIEKNIYRCLHMQIQQVLSSYHTGEGLLYVYMYLFLSIRVENQNETNSILKCVCLL